MKITVNTLKPRNPLVAARASPRGRCAPTLCQRTAPAGPPGAAPHTAAGTTPRYLNPQAHHGPTGWARPGERRVRGLLGLHGPLTTTRHSAWRHFTASLLRQASRSLARLARQLHRSVDARRRRPPELEFYAEAGAPEGALYLDGELVGHLPGVTRL